MSTIVYKREYLYDIISMGELHNYDLRSAHLGGRGTGDVLHLRGGRLHCQRRDLMALLRMRGHFGGERTNIRDTGLKIFAHLRYSLLLRRVRLLVPRGQRLGLCHMLPLHLRSPCRPRRDASE